MQNCRKTIIVIAFIEFLSAILLYNIYTTPIRIYAVGVDNYWDTHVVLSHILDLSFILIPSIALFTAIKGKNLSLLFIGLFPFTALLHGATPIPLAHYFYGEDININAIFIGLINLSFVIYTIYLFFRCKEQKKKVADRKNTPT